MQAPIRQQMVVVARIASNDNAATSPTREHLRAAIILVWWEGELARLFASQAPAEALSEAHDKVRQFRASIPADLLATCRATVGRA